MSMSTARTTEYEAEYEGIELALQGVSEELGADAVAVTEAMVSAVFASKRMTVGQVYVLGMFLAAAAERTITEMQGDGTVPS